VLEEAVSFAMACEIGRMEEGLAVAFARLFRELKTSLNIRKELKAVPIADYTAEEVAEYETAIAKFVKRTGAEGVELRNNGNKILRFTSYDPTGTAQDKLLAYTNVEEVNAFRIAQEQATAKLP
jgi:hypothetical protein